MSCGKIGNLTTLLSQLPLRRGEIETQVILSPLLNPVLRFRRGAGGEARSYELW